MTITEISISSKDFYPVMDGLNVDYYQTDITLTNKNYPIVQTHTSSGYSVSNDFHFMNGVLTIKLKEPTTCTVLALQGENRERQV